MSTSAKPAARSIEEYAGVALLLAFSVFLTHFLRFHEFGLYEDDYWSVGAEMGRPLSDLGYQISYHFQHWLNGRPLNHLFPIFLGRIGYRIGGLPAMYIIGAAWLSVNAFLAYLIARRFFGMAPSAITGLAYVLFPADTTKILLIHISHIQGAMTFMLLGLWLWLKKGRWRWAGYLVGGVTLLSYESAFLPFLCAPLLLPATNEKKQIRVWVEHITVCALMVIADAAIRTHTGDPRLAASAGDLGKTLYRSLTSLYIGPATSGPSFLRAAFVGYARLNIPALFLSLALIGLIVYLMLNLKVARETSGLADGDEKRRALLVGAAALVTWPASYALTLVDYNYPPTQQMGRLTSTHVPAGWPAALLLGAIASLILGLGARERRVAYAVAGFAFIGLFSYHQYIQAEYVRAWGLEKKFWSQVVELAPDVDGSSIIIAGSPAPNRSPVIGSNSWADDEACQRIFGVNAAGMAPHFAHLGIVGASIVFRKNGDTMEWNPEYWEGTFLKIDPANLILFTSDQGILRRVETIEVSAGPLISTRPIPPARRGVWPPTVVSRILAR